MSKRVNSNYERLWSELERRAGRCHGCDARGTLADTDAGEIVVGGEVLGALCDGAPFDLGVALMCGRRGGADLGHVYCDDCADDEEVLIGWDQSWQRDCTICGRTRTVVPLPPKLLAEQPDDTTHVCHPALGGCNHGFAVG